MTMNMTIMKINSTIIKKLKIINPNVLERKNGY